MQPPIPRIAVPRVMHGLHYRIRIRHKYFTSPESPGSGDPDFSYPLTSCASSAVRCLWSRSHCGRMSVKLLADCAADKGQCRHHSMSSSALQGAGPVSKGILLLTYSGSFSATPFRWATWRASALYSKWRIRASDHALSYQNVRNVTRREILMIKNSRAVQDVLVFDLRLLILAC